MTSDPQARFLNPVLATIRAHALLPQEGPPAPVIVGTSGGPDSVALLCALAELAGPSLPITPIAAHLHHGLRGEAADEDQRFVEALARRLNLACDAGRADVRAEAVAAGIGIEEAGRRARRRFLADAARRHGARHVALAHHADDRAETVLFHVLRGTGVEGLASLGPRAPLAPEEGIVIVRPLIDVRREDILAYLQTIGQPFREDESNSSDAHTRNRVRHELLPLARQAVNPKADEALVRLSDQAAAAADVLADALDDVWRRIVRETPGEKAILVDADDFAHLRPWLQGAIVRRAVERLGGGLKFMSAEWTRQVVAAMLSGSVAGPADLPDGLTAARRRGMIRFGR